MVTLLTSSCSEDDEPTADTVQPPLTDDSITARNTSELITSLNGFRFEAAFENTEPLNYPYLWVAHIEDYLDSVRIVTLNQNVDLTITKYLASNFYGGSVTRQFDHRSFPNNVSNSTSFAFNHPQFLLQWYVRSTGELTTVGQLFGLNTGVSQTFTGMLPQYSYEFLDRFLLRYISGISIWPFDHGSWGDQPQFVATSELSEPTAWDHWYDETWAVFPYNVQSNIGVAKGNLNLDTVTLDYHPVYAYDRLSCHVYLDKSGDTLYMGLINNVPGITTSLENSLYYYVLGSNQINSIYEHLPFSHSANNVEFHKGSFYAVPLAGGYRERIDKSGTVSAIQFPATTFGVQLKFSKNKLYAIVTDSGNRKRVEIYSKQLD
jgi:hypothetical protein